MKKLLSFMVLAGVMVLSNVAFAAELTPEMCKEKAIAAANLLAAEGAAAYDKIKDPNGEFRFGEGKGYVWIQTVDAKMLMHPIKPSLDGKDLMDMQDNNGTYIFVAFGEIAEDNEGGWVPYVWPKPGEDFPSPKVSYVVKATKDGVDYVAGSGMYDVTVDDIKKQFPGDVVYED